MSLTVYPGATEEDCIPVLEKVSGLKFNQDFLQAIAQNGLTRGDKLHRVTNILKITSGSYARSGRLLNIKFITWLLKQVHIKPLAY